MAPSDANLSMGYLEERLLASTPDHNVPAFYKHFMDSVFCPSSHGEEVLEPFLEHANN